MIQSTFGMSSPLAATSVQSKMPFSALQNSKKVFVRFCCFCLPCISYVQYRSARSVHSMRTCRSRTGTSI